MAKIRTIQSSDPLGDWRVRQLLDILRGGDLTAMGSGDLDVKSIVSDIIEQVRTGGSDAVSALTAKVDKRDIPPAKIRVPAEKIAAAHAAADKEFLTLARKVIENIRRYQEHIKHADGEELVSGGRKLGVRYRPVDRVGLYVPGWRAIYPSSVLMTIVPAQVAGVREIAIAAPPTDDSVNEMTLALAAELGITEVYRVGGAIAIAALAFGTNEIKPVQMIAGPGNSFVAEAKLQLCGKVAIDSVAGASEVLIIADDTARADFVAADLLAQAEHNPGSAVLVTDSPELAKQVAAQLDIQLEQLTRRDETARVLELYSGIIIVENMDTAIEVANEFAAEHLQIQTADSRAVMEKIRHAGAIFLGENTPVPVGDYFAGPSHVLPTRSTARFFSALSVNSFLKSTSVLEYDYEALNTDAEDICDFALREGLDAHASAVAKRIEKK